LDEIDTFKFDFSKMFLTGFVDQSCFWEGVNYTKIFMPEYSRSHVHTCDVDMRRAYAIGVLDSIEDTSKVHMYWLKVQGVRVKAFVVCCLLLVV